MKKMIRFVAHLLFSGSSLTIAAEIVRTGNLNIKPPVNAILCLIASAVLIEISTHIKERSG